VEKAETGTHGKKRKRERGVRPGDDDGFGGKKNPAWTGLYRSVAGEGPREKRRRWGSPGEEKSGLGVYLARGHYMERCPRQRGGGRGSANSKKRAHLGRTSTFKRDHSGGHGPQETHLYGVGAYQRTWTRRPPKEEDGKGKRRVPKSARPQRTRFSFEGKKEATRKGKASCHEIKKKENGPSIRGKKKKVRPCR